jgi:Protein of unknown function (DUF2891)
MKHRILGAGSVGISLVACTVGLAAPTRLAAELRRWDDADAQRWSATLAPLEAEASARLEAWLPRLHYPIRIGEHDQTAFSFGLMWDWAAVSGDERMRALLRDAAARFYRHDRNCPLAYESGPRRLRRTSGLSRAPDAAPR